MRGLTAGFLHRILNFVFVLLILPTTLGCADHGVQNYRIFVITALLCSDLPSIPIRSVRIVF
jgi:hypothetical protein